MNSQNASKTGPTTLGWIEVEDFLARTKGKVIGQVNSDGKIRTFSESYSHGQLPHDQIWVQRSDGWGDRITIPGRVPIDEDLIGFFGLYAGDGAKGSEEQNNPGELKVAVSFCQKEPNLIRFATGQFKKIFPGQIRFTLSLGEDSAYFLDGEGKKMLADYYGGKIPKSVPLSSVKANLSSADTRYLSEKRDVIGSNQQHLAFYYQHKAAMEHILIDLKKKELAHAGIKLGPNDKVTASLRRPFKKGARKPGGTSRADELHIGGLNGIGELFLKMLYELESSIYLDTKSSPQGLARWQDTPSKLGEVINTETFFSKNPFGSIAGERPSFHSENGELIGIWPRSTEHRLKSSIKIDPLFAYASGLYLAEGTTSKEEMFAMYSRRPDAFAVSFTSSDDRGVGFTLRALAKVFPKEDIVNAWKVKVGSQYFPELVVIGQKHGVPMLRGGPSGQGKLRTMEISIAVRAWALDICPSLVPFADRYSHVEPTGSGVARVDFWASSSLGKWFFPLIVYAVFHNQINNPKEEFTVA